MRKVLVLLIMTAMVVTLAACGSTEPQSALPDTPAISGGETEPRLPKPDGPVEGLVYLGLVEDPVVVEGAELKGFSITVQGVEITNDDLAQYPVYSVETTSTNMYGTTTTRVYIGYKMSDVLDAAGVTESFTTLVTVADDGYSIKVSREVAMEPTSLVAVSEDGKLFRDGPWFAPCSSNVTPDYLRELIRITLEN